MNRITKKGITFPVSNFPWEKDFPAKPATEVTVGYDDAGYRVRMVSYETTLRAVETAHNTPVCQDSCMELFMQFAPESDPRYINIEVNPNGAAYCGVNYRRGDSILIDPADIDTLCIRTAVYDDRWEIEYVIPSSFIQKYIPAYRHGEGTQIRGNFYKCGDMTDHTHYGCFANIEWDHPDFHRPEFFADFLLTE